MNDYMEFLKNLFFAMLYFTGILACFCICIGLIDATIHKQNKQPKNMKVINLNEEDLDDETKKELDNIAQKLAKKYTKEMMSDEYEKED